MSNASNAKNANKVKNWECFLNVGLALDPIHVGTGGTRIGRVDLTIVRDPVTRVPKIPGSSLAGVYRAYVAMHEEEKRRQQQNQQARTKAFYPDCAGVGLGDGKPGHCRQPDCPVCTVFGYATGTGQAGGFAGLAAFSDAHVLLFPVPTRKGPMWITCPQALQMIEVKENAEANAVYLPNEQDEKANSTAAGKTDTPLNLGWLLLPVRAWENAYETKTELEGLKIPESIRNRIALVSDRLFSHIVNCNLEVRTSVSINPATGAAEDGALFSYEALPRGTVLVWEIIAKNPTIFGFGNNNDNNNNNNAAVTDTKDVHDVAREAHSYLKYLGIGGMGTRGMGRLEVLYSASRKKAAQDAASSENGQEIDTPSNESAEARHE